MRRAGLLVLLAGACLAESAVAGPSLSATLSCPEGATLGRVTCELELEIADGKLGWGDALVLSAPDFARPLRSRVGPREATSKSERRMRLPIALAATAPGEGRLEVRGRAVACARERCRPLERIARTELRVAP